MGKTRDTGFLNNCLFTDSSNNVGIGAAANASYKLQVTGTTNLTGALSGTSATFSGAVQVGITSGYLNVGSNVNSGFATYIKAGASGILLSAGTTSSDNTLLIQNAAETTTLFNIKGNGAATFSSSVSAASADFSGAVGTGVLTSTISSAVNAIFNSTNANGGYITFRRSGTPIGYLGNSAQLGIGTLNALELRADNNLFLTTTSGTLSILSGGNVGIGTSSPTNALHLVNANHYQFKIQDSAASMLFGADDGIMLGIEMANSAGANWFIGNHDPGTSGIQDRLTIGRLSGTWSYPAKFSSGGNLTILGTLTQNASDIRLKDNIVNIPNALNKILSLNGFIFNWNELASSLGPYSTDIKQVGVSAQEIQLVLPEAVFLAPFDVDSFDDNKSKSGETYLTVQYDKIIPLLIEGIKEQQALIIELTQKVNALENK
jgi:hypothetical protein